MFVIFVEVNCMFQSVVERLLSLLLVEHNIIIMCSCYEGPLLKNGFFSFLILCYVSLSYLKNVMLSINVAIVTKIECLLALNLGNFVPVILRKI